MSNYTIQVGWSGKDALADSDPEKVISGDLFNTEFTAVQSAINTKAELNGNASEAFNATTAVVGTNSTQVATTAFTTASIAAIPTITSAVVNALTYPIGSVYTSVVSTDPSTLLGVGTWAAFGAGRVLMGTGGGYTAGDTGGAATHTLTTAEMPSHTHTVGYEDNSWPDGAGDQAENNVWNSIRAPDEYRATTATGGNGSHNNLQPYIVVYFWKRTA